jgi:hypothetical protein
MGTFWGQISFYVE